MRTTNVRHVHLFTLVAACVVGAACADDGPVSPKLDPNTAPAVNYTHHTGPPGCSGSWVSCLYDDVLAPWTFQNNSGDYIYELVEEESDLPTTRGGTVHAHVRRRSKTTGAVLSEGEPACYSRSDAYFPDGRVTITGRNVDCIYQFWTLTSYARIPVPEILEFERPDSIACQSYKECPGPFRIKLRLEGAGWYRRDETRIFSVNAAGSAWNRTNASRVVDDNTIEFTFSTLYYPGPGSRIRILYQPWGTSRMDNATEIYLPFDAPSPELILTASPSSISVPGEVVSFTADAPGDPIVEVLEWNWVPQDTSIISYTNACDPRENPCSTAVYESGTMEVTARVDGRLRQATADVSSAAECPPDLWMSDPEVMADLQEMWEASYPDSAPSDRQERGGFIVEYINGYDIIWSTATESDACSIHMGPASQAPALTVAWVHTHPATGTFVPSGACEDRPDGLAATSGASFNDRRYAADLSDHWGAEIPAIILEPGGVVRYDSSSPPNGVPWARCRDWQS